MLDRDYGNTILGDGIGGSYLYGKLGYFSFLGGKGGEKKNEGGRKIRRVTEWKSRLFFRLRRWMVMRVFLCIVDAEGLNKNLFPSWIKARFHSRGQAHSGLAV